MQGGVPMHDTVFHFVVLFLNHWSLKVIVNKNTKMYDLFFLKLNTKYQIQSSKVNQTEV